jgi:hypothetical protein
VSLRIRFRFDGRCSVHPRYNPDRDGRPEHKDCSGCESLWVIHLYSGIARRKAEAGDGIIASGPVSHSSTEAPATETEEDQIDKCESERTCDWRAIHTDVDHRG